jgi:outer membrane protein OmpA-like peptidoglycan-associated protein
LVLYLAKIYFVKSFLPVLLTFMLYAAACLFLLNFFFLKEFPVKELSSVSEEVSSQITTKETTEQPESLEREINLSTSTGLIKKDSLVLNHEEKGSSLTSIDSIVLSPETSKKVQTITYEPQTFAVFNKNDESLIGCNSYATIYKGTAKVKIPYNCINYGIEIQKILAADDKASLTITGYSTDGELNTLGKERAEYIKKLLLGIGIDNSRIKTNSTFQNISFNNGAAKGGVLMKMDSYKNISKSNAKTVITPINTINGITKSTDPFAYKKITSGFQGDYFYGNQSFTLYINKVKDYLQKNPKKKLKVYSHTTSVGNNNDNMTIAKSNTANAKKLILQSGIPRSKVIGYSMGEKPVDENGSSTCLIITVN